MISLCYTNNNMEKTLSSTTLDDREWYARMSSVFMPATEQLPHETAQHHMELDSSEDSNGGGTINSSTEVNDEYGNAALTRIAEEYMLAWEPTDEPGSAGGPGTKSSGLPHKEGLEEILEQRDEDEFGEEEECVATINCLPEELLAVIFSHLDHGTLIGVVSQVSTYWYRVSLTLPVTMKITTQTRQRFLNQSPVRFTTDMTNGLLKRPYRDLHIITEVTSHLFNGNSTMLRFVRINLPDVRSIIFNIPSDNIIDFDYMCQLVYGTLPSVQNVTVILRDDKKLKRADLIALKTCFPNIRKFLQKTIPKPPPPPRYHPSLFQDVIGLFNNRYFGF